MTIQERAPQIRPRTRGECPPIAASGWRECPWAGCRHHLYLDVQGRRVVTLGGDLATLAKQRPMCSLDVAEMGWGDGVTDVEQAEMTTLNIGQLLGVTSARAHQILTEALRKVSKKATMKERARELGLDTSTARQRPPRKRVYAKRERAAVPVPQGPVRQMVISGSILKAERQRLGLSVRAAARLARMSQVTVAGIERDDRRGGWTLIRAQSILRLCVALQIDPVNRPDAPGVWVGNGGAPSGLVDAWCMMNYQKLIELRKSKGWSRLELSKRAGVSRGCIERHESGKSRRISRSVAMALCDALGVGAADLGVVEVR